ncbi:MAG: NAD(P)/FAD-dependent oxidoreductase [Candidatus Cloacimonas sp.]|jgi:L-2-hydroxyglutarate oxidase LhgO|nr:NAD(P)/FAD-dependent oxidoreductase [Candidatus Cloacimonas sp.]
MESVRTLVIGAGAIGLAIAYELSKQDSDLVVVEKESSFGKHTSSRNSEVIHAGHYYSPGSLKASLCVDGNKLLYSYLQENSLPHKNTGKIIVSTSPAEETVLQKYLELGTKNRCEGFRLISKDEVTELEPLAKCTSGLYIPSTGIFDTHQYMQSLASKIEEQDAFIVYGMEVETIRRENNKYIVQFLDGEIFQCEYLINSAGLWADQIAIIAGMDTKALNIEQHWCKGEYYKTTKIKGINHLVYPVADPKGVFLGIHLTINLAGEVRFGPNAFYLDKVDYHFEEGFFEEFYTSINRYIDVNRDDLMPDDTGIRPKLQGHAEGFRDFYIKEETANGLPGFINLIGMESPGLTASLAIAKYVASLLI